MTQLYVFDFYGVMYRHTEDCPQRMLGITAHVNAAFTGKSFEQSIKECEASWGMYRNGFYHLISDERLHVRAHKAAARLYRDDVYGVHQPDIVAKINELSKHANVCIVSHSITNTLHMMMTRMQFSPVLIDRHAFGMDQLGGGDGWARKDDFNSNVFQWICDKYGVLPSDAMMIEDTARNLEVAKHNGMETCHINWGNSDNAPFIDTSYFQTVDFLDKELEKFNAKPDFKKPSLILP